jgi:putative Holliday junction resolvase
VPVTHEAHVFLASLPPVGSLLALDLSKRRIGLAGTDPGRRLVTALETIERRGLAADVGRLRRVAEGRRVAGLVAGWPLNMDGSIGPRAQACRDWAGAFAAALGLPALLQDERLTSAAVGFAIEEGRLPRQPAGAPLDHYAAAVILEDALRALAHVASP